MVKVVCPKCDTILPAEAEFCTECGFALYRELLPEEEILVDCVASYECGEYSGKCRVQATMERLILSNGGGSLHILYTEIQESFRSVGEISVRDRNARLHRIFEISTEETNGIVSLLEMKRMNMPKILDLPDEIIEKDLAQSVVSETDTDEAKTGNNSQILYSKAEKPNNWWKYEAGEKKILGPKQVLWEEGPANSEWNFVLTDRRILLFQIGRLKSSVVRGVFGLVGRALVKGKPYDEIRFENIDYITSGEKKRQVVIHDQGGNTYHFSGFSKKECEQLFGLSK